MVLTRAGVLAALQSEAVQDMRKLIDEALTGNVISVKALRTLAGKLSNAARLLTTWRPFLAELWAALHADPSRAPPKTVWTRQVQHSLRWFAAFLGGQSLSIMRPFLWEAFELPANRTVFTVDASPFGFGAVLTVNGEITEYLTDQLTDYDCKFLGVAWGKSDSQQVMEALGMVVALRTWKKAWQHWRSVVAVRGDNVTMLTMVARLKGCTPALSLLARELALEVARAAYRPIVAEHIPGVANVAADALSRLHDPSGAYRLPAELVAVKRVMVDERHGEWYETLHGPPGGPGIGASGAAWV